jgi:hypothetical protein
MQTSKISFRIVTLILAATLITACSKETKKARFLAEADNYFTAGDYDKAKLSYLNVLRLDPAKRTMRLVWKRWLELFAKPIHLYWSYHYQFERKKLSVPVRLIGKERGRILTVNVVLPALLSHASHTADKTLEYGLHLLYKNHPKLSPNSITRLMEHRLFGSQEQTKRFVTSASRQQALHHFFFDFCDNRESLCSRCGLVNEKQPDELD